MRTYPNGYSVEVRLYGLHTMADSGLSVEVATPYWGDLSQHERQETWREFARYLRSKGVSGLRLQRFWREFAINRPRWFRQRNRTEQADTRGILARIRDMKLTPETFKYDRAVGVEIECYGPQMGDKLPLWAREKGDGSLSSQADGVEFNLLLKREYLEPRLFRFCSLLQQYGHKVDKTCGLHIHLDMRGREFEDVKKLAGKLDKWLKALRELVPASRRENNYCQFGVSTADRYKAVNLCSFEKFRTLEVRLHSGTTDYTKIISWIRLVELCAAMPKAPKTGSCIATLESLPLPSHEMAYWLARHKELNPRIYNTVATSTENEDGTLNRPRR